MKLMGLNFQADGGEDNHMSHIHSNKYLVGFDQPLIYKEIIERGKRVNEKGLYGITQDMPASMVSGCIFENYSSYSGSYFVVKRPRAL